MIQQFDQFQKFGQDNLDTVMKTFGSVTKGAQAIAMETADYAKKSVEQSAAAFEKLAGAKSLDKAMQIHGDYLKTSYEGFVAQSAKIGELYQAVAKEAFKPFEGFVAKAAGK
ncbi:MAG TPA: phasin family protein [Microvirga sp.]|nr:phasin family protein [Microvirga sp.]